MRRFASMRWLCLFLPVFFWGLAGWAASDAVRWWLARSWPAVPCVIVRSWVEEVPGDKPYVFRVTYCYTLVGRQYDGRIYQEDYHGSTDLAEAERLARALPTGSQRVCYVNPRHPSQAVVE